MPKSRTGTTTKKSDLKIKGFFSPGLPKKPCGGLSAAIIERAARVFLIDYGITAGTLSLVFVTGRTIRKINNHHLGHDYITDIVTFDLHGETGGTLEGELFICPAQAARNARAWGEPIEREILRYVAHGILHLLGHDDATDKQRASMRKQEDKMLALIWP